MTFTELWSTHPNDLGFLDEQHLRDRFVVRDLFRPGELSFAYAHDDRLLIGGVRVQGEEVPLEAPDALRAEHFLERRELGVVCLDGSVEVTADDESFSMGGHDVLYLPMGTRRVAFRGDGTLYLVSAPAHRAGTAALAARDHVEALHLGSAEQANERTIRKYIHADGIAANQLVLGITTLAAGSVWNTMPSHLHARRTEIYLYDGLGDNVLVHLMGEPGATRHLMLHDRDAVVSPPWSIHTGVATGAYSFVWAMAGENVDYSDVEAVEPKDLR
ncbi:5-dehydro-4-deoxy-D-glucuronate isomerase [Microbacterium paludicola]|uniref:5-dehydro-4-deoxy-D-glucuronate isomerase n=1 Tax=Microbacterium paludicola TaxID=300019 RepID=UPI0031D65E5D